MSFQSSDIITPSAPREDLAPTDAPTSESSVIETTTSRTGTSPLALSGLALAAGVGAATLLAAQPVKAQTYASRPLTFADIPGTGDVKVLNFALALEDLEADLYDQSIMRLTSGGTTTYGERITGLNVNDQRLRYFREFRRIEREHAAFLRSAITQAGGTPISKFRYNFGLGSATPAAQQLNARQLTNVVLDAERTGVAAYLAGVTLFQVSSPYLQTAASIQGTEARHTAVIFALENLLYGLNANIGPVPAGVSSAARNDIDQYGREVTQRPNDLAGSPPLITTPPTPYSFEAQPDTVATPNSVLAKVSPFIVMPSAPNVS